MEPLRMRIATEDDGRRLDAVVARGAGVSRAVAAGLVAAGAVTVDGRAEPKSYRVSAGELVVAVPQPEPEAPPAPEGVGVVFEDDHLLVVDKPAGVVVHAAPGLREGTLVDALAASGRELAAGAGAERPGIVHRLDRDVSGLLVVAKTDEARVALSDALARRDVERVYVALVAGDPEVDTGKVDAPIGRHPRHRTRMAVLPEGRPAVTWFRVRERFGTAALLEVRLETGRTHQIRAHLESIGHPIVGDPAYGRNPALGRTLGLRRPFLHARRLAFTHPATGERVEFRSDLPEDLRTALGRLR